MISNNLCVLRSTRAGLRPWQLPRGQVKETNASDLESYHDNENDNDIDDREYVKHLRGST